jgi:hypothetical protein
MDANEARQELIVSLIHVRKLWDEGADDWQHALLRTFREYLRAIGVANELVHPLLRMLNDVDNEILETWRRRDGKAGTPMPIGKAMTLSFAAAAVTVLKERGDFDSIDDAVKTIARSAGLPWKVVKQFRDNLNRHAFSDFVVNAYQQSLAEVRKWPRLIY